MQSFDTRTAWLTGVDKELAWRRAYFTNEGLNDCAAGTATTVGNTLNDHRIEIVAVDALAVHYRAMLEEIGLTPPVPTTSSGVELLDQQFAPRSFDLVHMRFALDHCYNPLEARRQMTQGRP